LDSCQDTAVVGGASSGHGPFNITRLWWAIHVLCPRRLDILCPPTGQTLHPRFTRPQTTSRRLARRKNRHLSRPTNLLPMEPHPLFPLVIVPQPPLLLDLGSNGSGFSHNSKWEKRIQSANQTVIISASCVPLRPDDAPEEEFAKILVFDQKPMRRTAWNHIWIPYDQIGLESLKSASPPAPPPAPQPTSPPAEADKIPEGVAPTTGSEPVGPDTTWGIPDQGLKVWLRRTFIFQLMSVPDRY
jgi:hypothetical protein